MKLKSVEIKFSPLFPLGFAATFWLTSSIINLNQHNTTHANTTMAKVLTSIVLLSSSAQAFLAWPITSRNDINSHSSLKMSEIRVVSQPDKDFLEKKGVFNWGTWGCGVSKFPCAIYWQEKLLLPPMINP